jgi:TolB-like protein/Tfp pilus assembly protein PilF/DNA-binding winged helix-turn-helix (wHTH) protein
MGPSSSDSSTLEPTAYRVGDLLIDIGRQRVTRGEVELPLSQLSFELLLALARAAPNLLSFDQLMEQVWPGLVITPETVSQRVKLVRDGISDNSQAPRYIAGVRGRGYRMVAQVTPVDIETPLDASADATSDRGSPSSRPEQSATSVLPAPSAPAARSIGSRLQTITTGVVVVILAISASILTRYFDRPPGQGAVQSGQFVLVQQPKTIAVLPLVDLSPNGGNDYIGDGLAQELSSRLARIPGLRVASQTSAFSYKGSHADVRTIARALGVRHVLEGSVRREGDHIRVTAELVDALSGYHVWSQSYDRNWQDLLVIQDDLSRSIISTLQVVLSSDLAQRIGQPPTAQIAAFDLYLSGIAKLRQPAAPGQLDTAEEMFRDALAIDSRFAPAYAGLCERYTIGYEGSRDVALAAKAETACKKALEIDSSLREVEMGLAHLYLVTGRAEQAAVLLHSVIGKDPSDADAYIGLADAYEGQHKTAEAEISYQRAVDAEPSYANAHTALGNFLLQHGRATAAVSHFKRVAELVPGSAAAFNNLGGALLMSGDFQSAASAFDRSLKIAPSRSAYSNSGTVYYFLGRFTDAANMFRKATELAPEDHRVWGNLADALYQIPDKRAAAEQEYRHAISLGERRVNVNPSDGTTWSQLAFYHARVGETSSTAPCLSRARALGADDVFVQYYAALTELEQHNIEAAFESLHHAINLGYPAQMVRAAPEFAHLLQDARFQNVLAATSHP